MFFKLLQSFLISKSHGVLYVYWQFVNSAMMFRAQLYMYRINHLVKRRFYTVVISLFILVTVYLLRHVSKWCLCSSICSLFRDLTGGQLAATARFKKISFLLSNHHSLFNAKSVLMQSKPDVIRINTK